MQIFHALGDGNVSLRIDLVAQESQLQRGLKTINMSSQQRKATIFIEWAKHVSIAQRFETVCEPITADLRMDLVALESQLQRGFKTSSNSLHQVGQNHQHGVKMHHVSGWTIASRAMDLVALDCQLTRGF